MMFIVTFIALMIERFFDWSHIRQWNWFIALQQKVARRFTGKSPYLSLALTVLPLMIVVGVINFLLDGLLYGFVVLVFDLFILLYCFGPKNLWADAFSCINALIDGDAHYAADKLKSSFGITDISYSQSLHRHLLNDIFIEANRRVFAVVFWYVLLGPVGAVLYRTISLTATEVPQQELPAEISQTARTIESVLDWLPVRLFTFLFALGGHFVQVLSCWRKNVVLGLSNNETLLTECGTAALGCEDQGKIPEDGSAEKNAVHLLDRAFVILLVIIAVAALVI